jgi:hypothetical protein
MSQITHACYKSRRINLQKFPSELLAEIRLFDKMTFETHDAKADNYLCIRIITLIKVKKGKVVPVLN